MIYSSSIAILQANSNCCHDESGLNATLLGWKLILLLLLFFNKATARKVSRWMKCTQHLSKKKHGELPTNGRVEIRYCLLQYWMASTNKVAHVCISNPLAYFKVTRFPVLSSLLLRPIHQLNSIEVPKVPGTKHTSHLPPPQKKTGLRRLSLQEYVGTCMAIDLLILRIT